MIPYTQWKAVSQPPRFVEIVKTSLGHMILTQKNLLTF